MNTEWNANHALLVGEAMEEPTFSHASHGEDFFLVPVQSLRLSGTGDLLNVLLPRTLLEQCPVRAGERVRLEGEVRSYNNRSGVGHKLVITVLARAVTWDATGVDDNRVTLAGALCRRAVYRRTPLGREIADVMLAVNRRYGRADYLPCIAWGSIAQKCSQLEVGALLRLGGRLQSRAYTKVTEDGPVNRTAYEVSIMTLALAESTAGDASRPT
ncbi:MAG: single-stranded DNA-binding protein [Clostridiales bacterium]|nr:single-stranded DNA-binding protein [Clostridiales bacterium]MCD8367413.1 single-stranded DNA-binding protein [Clostridiales bacterium]